VMIEALACGLPVAAYPVTGPNDVIGIHGRGVDHDFPASIGCLDHDLARAIGRALMMDRAAAAVFARRFTWEAATDQFVDALKLARTETPELVD